MRLSTLLESLLRLFQLFLVLHEILVLSLNGLIQSPKSFLVLPLLRFELLLKPNLVWQHTFVNDLLHLFPLSVELLLYLDYLLVSVPD